MKLAYALLVPLFAVALNAAAAEEPDKRPPIDKYYGKTQSQLAMCQMGFRTATYQAELIALGGTVPESASGGGDFRGCISKGKAEARADLDKALRTVKKAKAQEALKAYHVAFVTALEGIVPGSDERRINYEQRQQSLDGKVTEAWARFEVER
jgi:hypothetical protein